MLKRRNDITLGQTFTSDDIGGVDHARFNAITHSRPATLGRTDNRFRLQNLVNAIPVKLTRRVIGRLSLLSLVGFVTAAQAAERKYVYLDGRADGQTTIVWMDDQAESDEVMRVEVFRPGGLSPCAERVFKATVGSVDAQMLRSCSSPSSQSIAKKCGCGN